MREMAEGQFPSLLCIEDPVSKGNNSLYCFCIWHHIDMFQQFGVALSSQTG